MIALGKPNYGAKIPIACDSFEDLLIRMVEKRIFSAKYSLNGMYIDKARNIIVQAAVSNNEKHLLFIDADMIIPEDAAERLLAHNLPVVGGLYFQKLSPHKPVAYDGWGKEFRPIQQFDNLRQVDSIGMGCTLINCDVLSQMQKHFGDEWWFEVTRTMGDDISFCSRCKEIGIPIYLDPSIECEHGEGRIGRQHYEYYKEQLSCS